MGDCRVTMTTDTSVTAAFGQDYDRDGAGDLVEDAGPNGGDGNSDGILDSQQDEVATFVDNKGEYVTLVTDSGIFSRTCATCPPSTENLPEGVTFPSAFFGFTITGLNPGASVQVTLLVHDPAQTFTTYYRYGPTPDDASDHWYEFLKRDGDLGAVITKEDAYAKVVLYFQDGQKGDDDLEANGTIVDIGGPGTDGSEPPISPGGRGGNSGCFLTSMFE